MGTNSCVNRPNLTNLRNKNIARYFVLWTNNEIHISSYLRFNAPNRTIHINWGIKFPARRQCFLFAWVHLVLFVFKHLELVLSSSWKNEAQTKKQTPKNNLIWKLEVCFNFFCDYLRIQYSFVLPKALWMGQDN